MKEIFLGFVSKLAEDYEDASTAKKALLICSAGGLLVALIVLGVRLGGSSVPVEEFRELRVGNLSKTDARGDVWVLHALPGQMLANLGDGPVIGEPLAAKADVEIREGLVSIGVAVKGQGGEEYVAGVMKNGQWQTPPKYKIVDASGKQLAADSFKYG